VLLDRPLSLTLALLIGSALVPNSSAANLAYSTYLKDGFTPKAMVSDAQGNLYLAGKTVTDPVSGSTTAVVAKFDPHAAGFLYLAYLDSTASDDVRAITVDSAGNAYVTGATVNPNFPATGGKLAALPTGLQDPRSFVTKLSPNGTVIFSVLLGGSAGSTAEAIALTPQGQILVSGVSASSGFPITAGAYTVADSKQHPFLMELDATAATVISSATGIGGSSIALDASGNIYVAGSTTLLDYPTTPGAYQTTFTPAFTCSGLCQVSTPGGQQYLSKVNPSGSQLIYSTGINGAMAYRSSSTQNTGLAVDASGNAYVTGVLDGGAYPFTTAPPANPPYEFGFLTELDSVGATVLYSIPIGGGGIGIDSSGVLYTAGILTNANPGLNVTYTPVAVPTSLAWVPSQCLPNSIAADSEAYVMKLDTASGAMLDTQWIDGSALTASSLALASGRVWLAGASQLADVPITPGAVSPASLHPGLLPGAYLSAVDFSQTGASASGGPQIACLVDGGNLMHAGPLAANQLLTIFGVNLGPAAGVVAPDGEDSSIAGVTVIFDGNPAQLLYVSASQINVVAPASFAQNAVTVMQVSVNGSATSPRQLPVTRSNPNLLADLAANEIACPNAHQTAQGVSPVATNADGSRNSCANPARLGSVVSFYVHGIGSPVCYCFGATAGNQSAAVINVVTVNSLVTRVDVQIPNSFATGNKVSVPATPEGSFQMSLSLYDASVGPLGLPLINVVNPPGAPGLSLPLVVWATQ
jgi:uncharacterized protein (TIGR03437 family)